MDSLYAELTLKDETLVLREETLTLYTKTLKSKEDDVTVLDRAMTARAQDIDRLQQEKASLNSSLDQMLRHMETLKANQNTEITEFGKDFVLAELRANGFIRISSQALMWAAGVGKVGPFQFGGYQAAFKDPETGMNYLHMASARGHVEVVRFLLSKIIDCNRSLIPSLEENYQEESDKCFAIDERTSTVKSLTALQLASQAGHSIVVDALLSAGADVNARARGLTGTTALQAAAACGHSGIVQRLLDAGASVYGPLEASCAPTTSQTDLIDSSHCQYQKPLLPAVDAAQAGGFENIVKMLEERAAIQRGPIVRSAIQNGELELVKRLLGSSIGRFENHGLLRLGIDKSDVELVHCLLPTCSPPQQHLIP